MPRILLSGVTVTESLSGYLLTNPLIITSGSSSVNTRVSINSSGGTLYFLASQNVSETSATIINNGLDQAVTTSGVQDVIVSGLAAATSYRVHFVYVGADLEESNVVNTAIFTTSGSGSGGRIFLQGVTVVAPLYQVTNITPELFTKTVTVNSSTSLLGRNITATYGGVSLTNISIQSANTFNCNFPTGGFPLGSINPFIFYVDGVASAPYQASYDSVMAAYVTLTVGYSGLHPDSPLRNPVYSDLVAGDQIFYERASQPGGYPVTISSTGLVTISNLPAFSPDQDVRFRILDASDNYAWSDTGTWTFDFPDSGVLLGNFSDVLSTFVGSTSSATNVEGTLYPNLTGFISRFSGESLFPTPTEVIGSLVGNLNSFTFRTIIGNPVVYRIKYTKTIPL